MITNNFEMLQLQPESVKNFTPKTQFTDFEHYGLKHALNDFIKEYEFENYRECFTNILKYTRCINQGVNILDGYYDTYIFDCYAIDYITLCNNGVILLYCYKVNNNQYNEYLPENIDYNSQVVFRLN